MLDFHSVETLEEALDYNSHRIDLTRAIHLSLKYIYIEFSDKLSLKWQLKWKNILVSLRLFLVVNFMPLLPGVTIFNVAIL